MAKVWVEDQMLRRGELAIPLQSISSVELTRPWAFGICSFVGLALLARYLYIEQSGYFAIPGVICLGGLAFPFTNAKLVVCAGGKNYQIADGKNRSMKALQRYITESISKRS